MVPDGQQVWTDRWNGGTDYAKTISLQLRQRIKSVLANAQFELDHMVPVKFECL